MDKIVLFARRKLLFQNFLCYKEDIIEPKKYVVIYVKLCECENCNVK